MEARVLEAVLKGAKQSEVARLGERYRKAVKSFYRVEDRNAVERMAVIASNDPITWYLAERSRGSRA